jgi:hypothetical protein
MSLKISYTYITFYIYYIILLFYCQYSYFDYLSNYLAGISPNVPAVTDVFLRPIRKNAKHFFGRKKMWQRKTVFGLRPLWYFAPPHFCGCWNATRSLIATAKTSYTAGTFCAIVPKILLKII